MQKNILNLLILCGILCQGLSGTSAEAAIRKPSDVLVRHKRVFSSNGSFTLLTTIQEDPYVVNIKTRNGQSEVTKCVGVILAPHAIVTASKCATLNINQYSIYSGSSYTNGGTHHSVVDKRIHVSPCFRNHRVRAGDGIALMFVNPYFVFSSTTATIAIHTAQFRPQSFGTISGWGYGYPYPRPTGERMLRLKSIIVRTLTNIDCFVRWEGVMQISANDICTHDIAKRCGSTDLGAPLVVNNHLVGIHLFSGGLRTGIESRPDIFARVSHPEYFNWINANIAHNK